MFNDPCVILELNGERRLFRLDCGWPVSNGHADDEAFIRDAKEIARFA